MKWLRRTVSLRTKIEQKKEWEKSMNVEPHSHKIRRRRRRRRRQCVTKWIRFVGRARAETRTRAQSCCIFNFALLSNNVIHLKICVRRCHACMSYTHRHTGDTLWISYIEEYWLAYIIGSARRVYAGTYTRHSTHSCKPMPIVCRYSVNEKEFFHICLTRTKGRVFFFFQLILTNWWAEFDIVELVLGEFEWRSTDFTSIG